MQPLGPGAVVALVTCHREPPAEELLAQLSARLPRVLVVNDGMPSRPAAALDAIAGARGARVLHLPRRAGKGHAIVAGIRFSRADRGAGDGVIVIDGDGQHPPDAIPAFLAASGEADLVVGNRFAGGGSMPLVRRLANRTASGVLSRTAREHVPDSQCGMRLLRGRALEEIEFPAGGMEAETLHLRRCLLAGVAVAWVPIPALYDVGTASSFRKVRDSVAVMRAAVAG